MTDRIIHKTLSHLTEEASPRPFSPIYQDIYWSNGATEKEAIFFTGNNIPQRLNALSSNETFIMAELGFGTGLNAAIACSHTKATNAQVHFISYELHPLSVTELTSIHQLLPPNIQPFLATIRHLWSSLQPGWNTYQLIPNLTLHLFFGDACTGLPSQPFLADAWLLDGFNPAKNPALWSPEIMKYISNLSRIGTTIATYSVARHVRDSLTTAGFKVQKQPGPPPKSEILTGKMESPPTPQS